jgi:predicted RNA binding protein YcfA (HicA-like mRNA interferase family)
MKLPRDVSGRDLARAAGVFGYEMTCQSGSHLRLTTQRNGEHHITIPAHDPLKIGTLAAILAAIAAHHALTREDVAQAMFGRQ